MIWKISRPSWNSDISLNFRNYLINLVLNTTCLCKGEGWDILNSCQESRKLREDVQFYSKTTMRAATPLCPIQVTTIYYTQCMHATLLLHGRIGGEILGNWQMATVWFLKHKSFPFSKQELTDWLIDKPCLQTELARNTNICGCKKDEAQRRRIIIAFS